MIEWGFGKNVPEATDPANQVYVAELERSNTLYAYSGTRRSYKWN